MSILFLKKYTYSFALTVVMMTFMFRDADSMNKSYKDACRDETLELLNTSKNGENNLMFDCFQRKLASVLEFYKKEAESKKIVDMPLKDESGEKTIHYWLFHGVTVEGFYQFTLENVNALSRKYGKINIDIPKSELDNFFVELGAYDSKLVSNDLNVNLIKLAVEKINKVMTPKSTAEKRFDDFKRSFRKKSAPKGSETNENINSSIATLRLDEGSHGNLGIDVPENAHLNLLLKMDEKSKVLVGTCVTDKDGEMVESSLINISPNKKDFDSQPATDGKYTVNTALRQISSGQLKVEEPDHEVESFVAELLADPDFNVGQQLVGEKKVVKAEKDIEVKKSSRFTRYLKYALGGAIFLICLYCNLQ